MLHRPPILLRACALGVMLTLACLSTQVPLALPSLSVPPVPSLALPSLAVPTIQVPSLGLTLSVGPQPTTVPTAQPNSPVPVTGVALEFGQLLLYSILALLGIVIVVFAFLWFSRRADHPDE